MLLTCPNVGKASLRALVAKLPTPETEAEVRKARTRTRMHKSPHHRRRCFPCRPTRARTRPPAHPCLCPPQVLHLLRSNGLDAEADALCSAVGARRAAAGLPAAAARWFCEGGDEGSLAELAGALLPERKWEAPRADDRNVDLLLESAPPGRAPHPRLSPGRTFTFEPATKPQ